MRYGRVAGLVLSLFLPAFYRHVARNWGGIGILYLLLLFTVTWIPTLVKAHLSVQKFAQEDFPKIAKDFPEIIIKNGKISSPVPQPYEIRDDNGNLVFVLDTTGQINNLDQTNAMVLLTETKLFQRDQLNNIQIHDLSNFPDFELTKDRLQGWINTFADWAAAALYPILMIGSMIRALVLMLLVSLVGLIFNSAFNAHVSYAGLLRFAAVGMTLSVYIDTGLGLANINTPLWFFIIALILTIAYVGFGTFVSVPEVVPPDYERHAEDRYDADDWRPSRQSDGGADDYNKNEGGFKSGRP